MQLDLLYNFDILEMVGPTEILQEFKIVEVFFVSIPWCEQPVQVFPPVCVSVLGRSPFRFRGGERDARCTTLNIIFIDETHTKTK